MFSVKKRLEIRFNDVLDRKETFFDYKKNICQRPQNRTFPKGLTHTFGKKKKQFFPFFLFGQNKTRNKVYDVLDSKETFYDNKTTIFQGLKNGIFPKGLTLRLVKKCNFFLDLFSVKKRLEIRFNDVLDRKETFFLTIRKFFEGLKKWHCTHAFDQKIQFFSLFVFTQNKTRKKV